MFIKLAWRNIWRNKRRSFITIASILFAMFFAVIMRAMQLGSYDYMINSIVHSFSGYIQVHEKGYWDEQTLDNSMAYNDSLIDVISNQNDVTTVVPRIESFALSSYGELTKGVMVVGIQPKIEEELLELSDKLIEGEIFSNDSKSVLIAQGLAEFYNIKCGDTLVLLSQGYHGVSAAGKYPVSGILKFGPPEINDRFIAMPLKEAQWFYGTEERITSLALLVDENRHAKTVLKELRKQLDTEKYEVMSWQEMMPDFVQLIQLDNVGGIIMLCILYMIITFGIFGTVLMMVAERIYEFGVMISMGMRRWKICLTVFIETFFMSLIGVIAGAILAEPLVYYFFLNPIELTGEAAESIKEFGWEPLMPTTMDPSIIIVHGMVIVLIALIMSLYPAVVITRLQPVKAMRV